MRLDQAYARVLSELSQIHRLGQRYCANGVYGSPVESEELVGLAGCEL